MLSKIVARSCTPTSSYITVDDDNGRALFYILAEATGSDPSFEQQGADGVGSETSKPLLLWLNG